MKEKNIALLKKILQSEGLRYTKQREAIWVEINKSKEHRNADEIYFSVLKKKTKVSRATVYRTIDVLVKHGLVKKIDGVESGSLYENKLDREHHDHMICLDTGAVNEFSDELIEERQKLIAEKYGYELVDHKLELYGVKKKK